MIRPSDSTMSKRGSLCEPLKDIQIMSSVWFGHQMEVCWPLVLMIKPSASGMGKRDNLYAPLKAILTVSKAFHSPGMVVSSPQSPAMVLSASGALIDGRSWLNWKNLHQAGGRLAWLFTPAL